VCGIKIKTLSFWNTIGFRPQAKLDTPTELGPIEKAIINSWKICPSNSGQISCTETERNNLEERKSKLLSGGRLKSRTYILREGADKSLARPTSRCRKKESIV